MLRDDASRHDSYLGIRISQRRRELRKFPVVEVVKRYERIALCLDITCREEPFEIRTGRSSSEDDSEIVFSLRVDAAKTNSTKSKLVDIRQTVKNGVARRLRSRYAARPEEPGNKQTERHSED